eukprot:521686-Pyramimonas_sp.AAC.1
MTASLSLVRTRNDNEGRRRARRSRKAFGQSSLRITDMSGRVRRSVRQVFDFAKATAVTVRM